MNDDRRKAIRAAIQKLEEAKAEIDAAKDDEQSYFDNMPESFQRGSRGSAAEDVIDKLDTVVNDLDSCISEAEEACA